MKYDIVNALQILYPNTHWKIIDTDYTTLEWSDNNVIEKPSLEILEKKVENLISLEPLRLLRLERNRRLADCDWIVIRAYSQGIPVSDTWKNYMQALRDLPTTTTPVLDPQGNLDMNSIDWPIPPE